LNPNTPFETVIDQIEESFDFADAGGQLYSSAQVINNVYLLVFDTGMFFDDCKTWNAKAAADKTWVIFKTHFLSAQHILRLTQKISRQAGF
jgi:hypothetical protein